MESFESLDVLVLALVLAPELGLALAPVVELGLEAAPEVPPVPALAPELELEGVTPDAALQTVLDRVEVPRA